MKAINRQRFGFTLVELLAVTVIIAILAGLTTLATTSAMRSAREAKTRGTISKLDAAIQEIFEEYEEKFESISFNDTGLDGKQINAVRLHLIRDLMRMEMPCQWCEVVDGFTAQNPGAGSFPKAIRAPFTLSCNSRNFQLDTPRVLEIYRKVFNDNFDANKWPNPLTASAELLFLVIMNLNPEALSSFNDSEIGDSDGNGLFEFHDAWGTPILFLRWAPAFPGSDRQPDVITPSGYPLGNVGKWNDGPSNWDNLDESLQEAMSNAVQRYSDPFDQDGMYNNWFLYPLVYSAGADKVDDIHHEELPARNTYTYPDILDPFHSPDGLPLDGTAPDGTSGNGVLNHYDNIHNHRAGGSF